jgi:hypothetical protein
MRACRPPSPPISLQSALQKVVHFSSIPPPGVLLPSFRHRQLCQYIGLRRPASDRAKRVVSTQ